jgi:hydrogenase maturation protease
MDREKKSTLVIGIGNILMKDEGIGIHVINTLINKDLHHNQDIEIIDGGTAGLGMLEYMKDKQKVIIIDAIDFKQPPGSLYRFNYSENDSYKKADKYSVHQIDVIDTIHILHTVYNHYPEIVIMGMQPFEIELEMNLSENAQEKLKELTDLVMKEIEAA